MRRRPRLMGRLARFAVCTSVPLLFAIRPMAAQEAAPLLTLDEVVDRALRHSPAIAQATGSVRNAESAERTAFGAYLPNLSVSSGTSRSSAERFNPQTNTTVTGSSESYNAGISASIDLFTGFRRGAEMDRTRTQTSATGATLIQQRYATILTAKRAYFDVLRADELIRISEARLARAREGLDAADRRAQVGSGTRSDLLRAQLEVNNARQALLQTQNQRRTATFALGRLVGVDGAVGARAVGPIEPAPLSIERNALIAEIVGQAPAVRVADANADAAEAALRASRSQYLPSVTASTGYDWSNQQASFENGNKSWSMRLGVSYPLFNRFQREDAVGRANVQADVTRIQRDDARRAARADVERILAAVDLAEQQILLAEETVAVAEEDLRVQQERYRLGVSTIFEQVTSQLNLVQAEVDRIAARYDFLIARAELEALAGRSL